MAINWNFNADDVEEGFPLIPVGDDRVRIATAEEKQSGKGNDMIKLTLDICFIIWFSCRIIQR